MKLTSGKCKWGWGLKQEEGWVKIPTPLVDEGASYGHGQKCEEENKWKQKETICNKEAMLCKQEERRGEKSNEMRRPLNVLSGYREKNCKTNTGWAGEGK